MPHLLVFGRDVLRHFLRAFLSIVTALGAVRFAYAQDTTRTELVKDSTQHTTLDTAYQVKPIAPNRNWRRPGVQYQSTSLNFSREAIRYYRAPVTLGQLFEDVGTVYPLVLGEEAYGRESWLSTWRVSEAPVTAQVEGFVPVTSVLSGEPLLNYFPLNQYSNVRFERGAAGMAHSGAEQAGSDDVDLTLERFRAPVPYSRVYYVQDLTRRVSDFDALFSINASRAVNTAFGLFRRVSGTAQNNFDPTFNPRTDVWSVRGQISLAASDSSRPHAIDGLLWGQYTTAFSGLSGGILRPDSGDIFDLQTASVRDINSFDHRIRGDALFDLSVPLLAESPTTVGAYYTYESRHFVSRDTSFPSWPPDEAIGTRYGATLAQPLNLSIGDFLTRAELRGDFTHVVRDSLFPHAGLLTDTRLAASFSDSLALRTAFRISLYGFVKTVQSNVKIGDGSFVSSVFPSVGFTGTIGFTDAVSFTASYLYARDRAELSPSPLEQYQLRNIAGFLDLHVPMGRDSLSIHAGVLDRHEPEGIVPVTTSDSLNPYPRFSGADVHSQSAEVKLDLFLGRFHVEAGALYFPNVIPLTTYTLNENLRNDLVQRFFGNIGVYYEHELQEGNLRLSAGARLRFIDRLEPMLTYDRASDYYWYRGLAPQGDATDPSTWIAITDSRVNVPHGVLDLLVASEIDRRAQVGLSFLNILGSPYYLTSVYPFAGFHWRLDVTWAFLD